MISHGLKRALARSKALLMVTGDSASADASEPNYVSASYREQITDVLYVRTVYGGTKTMREAGEDMLPKHQAEHADDYEARLMRAVLFNSLKRTVGGLVGMIFRRAPIEGDEMDLRISEHLANIDLAGRDLAAFARRLGEDAMIDGHAWLHIDAPRRPDGAEPVTRQQEREMDAAAGIDRRPYWVEVPKADAINVQWSLANGRPELTLFAYQYEHRERAGAFGEAIVQRIRVLEPGRFRVYELRDTSWEFVDGGTTSVPFVPVVFVPSNETDAFTSAPPLLDLAYESVAHYQKRSDHDWAAMFASSPMPVFFGTDEEGVEWGANRALFVEDSDGHAMILESSGASLEATRNDMKDSEARQAALGLQMLVRETRAAETEQAKLLDKAESDSALGLIAGDFERAINRALEIHAAYMGADPTAQTVQLNRDFHENELSPEMVRVLSDMVAKSQLDLETLWAKMVEGEVLPETFDAEIVRERIDSEPPPLPFMLGGAA